MRTIQLPDCRVLGIEAEHKGASSKKAVENNTVVHWQLRRRRESEGRCNQLCDRLMSSKPQNTPQWASKRESECCTVQHKKHQASQNPPPPPLATWCHVADSPGPSRRFSDKALRSRCVLRARCSPVCSSLFLLASCSSLFLSSSLSGRPASSRGTIRPWKGH